MLHFQLLFSISFANLFFLTLLQLTDSFWKPASETETEIEAEAAEEASASEQTAEAEDAGDDAVEESSEEAPVTEQGHVASNPTTAQPTSSEESSGAKSRSSSPPAPTRNGSRAAVERTSLSFGDLMTTHIMG